MVFNRLKIMMRYLIVSLILIGSTLNLSAQFTMDGEFRPRTHFKIIGAQNDSIFDQVDQEATAFANQRTRINFNYKTDDYSMKISVQDVRTFGSNSTLSQGAGNQLDLHEAWAELKIVKNLSFKVGRQELAYDDQRILGSSNWAQQARSHDLGLLKYEGVVTAHLGFAYNKGNDVVGSYESLKYLWLEKKMDEFNISALGMDVDGLLTAGGRAVYKTDAINVSVNIYSQSNPDDTDNKGLLLGLDGNYSLKNGLNFGLGFESQTGTEDGTLAFKPVFGTNHKYNGNLDYFYVGDYDNSTGLVDMYFSLGYKLNNWKFGLTAHQFNSYIEMNNDLNGDLGKELDVFTQYKINDDVIIAVGHSSYLSTESMRAIQNLDGINNETWLMIVFKPKFM